MYNYENIKLNSTSNKNASDKSRREMLNMLYVQ